EKAASRGLFFSPGTSAGKIMPRMGSGYGSIGRGLALALLLAMSGAGTAPAGEAATSKNPAPTSGQGNVEKPRSSIPAPGDAGVGAHTNIEIFKPTARPTLRAGAPAPAAPPSPAPDDPAHR